MSANGNSSAGVTGAATRSRLPRWTRHESLVLLQAKDAAERRDRRPLQPKRPKWAVVSSYCRRHGVERGAVQCRKRWGNLSWDFKKIVGWETKNGAAAAAAAPEPQHESFWDMRGEQRRARQLPSSFDREVYDAIVRMAAKEAADEDARMSDFGEELNEGEEANELPAMMVMPISARKYEPPASSAQECSDPETESDKKAGDESDKNSASQQDGLKQSDDASFRVASEGSTAIGKQVIEALERGNRMVAAQLEAQKMSRDLDREQRMAQADGLLTALNKLADAVGRIAEKL